MARPRPEAYNYDVNRTVRILLGVAALVLVVVASALAAPSERGRDRMAPVAASHQPQSPDDGETAGEDEAEAEAQPSAELLDRLVTKLEEAGITTDADTIAALAAEYGVGGAVRLLAWSNASSLSTDELAAMFESGMGWGEIAAELNGGDGSFELHPGIGSIMGNGGGQADGAPGLGLGRAGAPGQQKRQ